MTPEQIHLVQSTFARVEPISDQAAALFYGRLFEVAPDVRGMFPDDLTDQGRKLMRTLGAVVNGLDAPEDVIPTVERLGARHVAYGAQAAHYPVVGEVLLWTLEQGLGEAFTPDVRDAWATAYGIVSATMIGAASETRPVPT